MEYYCADDRDRAKLTFKVKNEELAELQKLMRSPRFYVGVENNAKSWDDIKTTMGKELNTVTYILPTDYKPVVEILDEKFLTLGIIKNKPTLYIPTTHEVDDTTSMNKLF